MPTIRSHDSVTRKIQALETQLATVQYDQQANGASSVAPLISGRVPVLISTGDTILTKETMETIFKTWTLAQASTTARTPRASGKEKKMSKFGTNSIPNDKANGERTKRQYPNSTSSC